MVIKFIKLNIEYYDSHIVHTRIIFLDIVTDLEAAEFFKFNV